MQITNRRYSSHPYQEKTKYNFELSRVEIKVNISYLIFLIPALKYYKIKTKSDLPILTTS